MGRPPHPTRRSRLRESRPPCLRGRPPEGASPLARQDGRPTGSHVGRPPPCSANEVKDDFFPPSPIPPLCACSSSARSASRLARIAANDSLSGSADDLLLSQ
ncbi:hypothetical protein NPIL_411051 [Nephila pilipes]|uniref:Uncharacterized protein n=1 Tax=Nephila pilipes TaxID=299642 RepID=A0A8X6IL04_NEPPI|nr:hypothetical protein NPIL_411051 [Nephila pilipes]